MTAVLLELGINKLSGCQCAAHAAQMDAWGVAGCREHRSEIVEWLRQGYDASNWNSVVRAAVSLIKTDFISFTDPLGSIVDEAIRRAKIKEEELARSAQIVVTANGVGDHLLGLAAATAWKRDNPDVPLTFVCKNWQKGWVDLFDVCDVVTTSQSPKMRVVCDVSIRGGMHYVEAIQRFPLSPPTVRPLPQETTEWASQYADCIVIAPGAGYKRPGAPVWACNNRVWLPSHWLALERLLSEAHWRVVAIDSDAQRVASFKEPMVGLQPTMVAALMKASYCVVSNESGMAHLAGALGVPCVVLSGPFDAHKIHGVWSKTRPIQGPLSCSGCRWSGPHYRPHCDTLCASLQAIQPSDVVEVVRNLDVEKASNAALATILYVVDSAVWDGRRRCFCTALSNMVDKPQPIIVETGCQRQEYDVGAGMSTTIFGLWSRRRDGRVWSVDINPSKVDIARRATSGMPVDVSVSDSVVFLKNWGGPRIDLLYLDSLDTYESGFAEHCLEEVKAALDKMAPGGLIMFDDTWVDGGAWRGKGTLAVPYLLSAGWEVRATSHQTIMGRAVI